MKLHVLLAKGLAIGLIVGAFSGFFGIGGGFLIVPGIMLGGGMPILNAIGSSLLSVGTFGLTTAVNYALSGLVDWTIAALFIAAVGLESIAKSVVRRWPNLYCESEDDDQQRNNKARR